VREKREGKLLQRLAMKITTDIPFIELHTYEFVMPSFHSKVDLIIGTTSQMCAPPCATWCAEG